mgnify:CR=1 FL=1
MVKKKAYANTALCKGCRLCVGACPVGAITPLSEINQKGYPIIEVDQDKCIGCGSCYRMCPDYIFEVR